jgi:hypothetical protein
MSIVAIKCGYCGGYHFDVSPLSTERELVDSDGLLQAHIYMRCQTCGHVQRVETFTVDWASAIILVACRQLVRDADFRKWVEAIA